MSKVLDKYFSRFFEKHGKNKGLKLLIDCIINKKYLNKNNYKLKNYNNQFIYFWSNATKEKEKSKKKSYYFLSNLNHIKDTIEYDDIIYNSVEHAYQAQKFIKSQRERFSINGDLGGWDGFKFFVKEEEIIKKINFWIKKDNIGIIAKMASNEKYDKKTKLIRDPNFVESVNLWIAILIKKFTIPFYKELLISTNNYYLCEFDRKGQTYPERIFWGGMIVENVLYGNNEMGKYLMIIRDILIS